MCSDTTAEWLLLLCAMGLEAPNQHLTRRRVSKLLPVPTSPSSAHSGTPEMHRSHPLSSDTGQRLVQKCPSVSKLIFALAETPAGITCLKPPLQIIRSYLKRASSSPVTIISLGCDTPEHPRAWEAAVCTGPSTLPREEVLSANCQCQPQPLGNDH